MIIPFDLKPKSNVLIAGCGGGFDRYRSNSPELNENEIVKQGNEYYGIETV